MDHWRLFVRGETHKPQFRPEVARSAVAKDSVANVSQMLSIDRTLLTDRVGHLSAGDLQLVLAGVDLVLGRE